MSLPSFKTLLGDYTNKGVMDLLLSINPVPRNMKNSREQLLMFIDTLDETDQNALRNKITVTPSNKRRRGRLPADEDPSSSRKRQKMMGTFALTQEPEVETVESVISGDFLRCVDKEVVNNCISRVIDHTSNTALRKECCIVCGRLLFVSKMTPLAWNDIPHLELLEPTHPHPSQKLHSGGLLYEPALEFEETFVCNQCLLQLEKGDTPRLSLANNMWIGSIPFCLEILSLSERLLIAIYFPAAYIVKIFPKNPQDPPQNHRLRGNVSTYRLNPTEAGKMAAGLKVPRPSMILASLINITFVGTKKKPLQVLPKLFQVRRKRVFDALIWLKNNNPLYAPLEISEADLVTLPEEGLPDEILVNLRYSDDIGAALKEHGGYIPLDEESGATSSNTHSEPAEESTSEHDTLFDMLPADFVVLPNNVDRMAESIEQRLAEDLLAEETQPDVFPLYSNGVLDLNGSEITDSDIFSHGVENIIPGPVAIDYGVRKGSAFISEYARVDDEGERFDGGPTNPNLLLGAHPVLFPYAAGGIEVDREEDVTFEAHVQWALEYGDKRFRKDLLFTFQVFSILQRRRICRSACVQARASDFLANSHLFEKLRPRDLILASREEAKRVPFSNPAVQLLRRQLTTVRARVMGTDESRVSIRAQIWGMTLRFNPPSIWMTINFADVADPIAQVLAGENLNLDDFLSIASMKTSQERSQIIAADPFAAAEFFHHFVKTLLVDFFGIDVGTRGSIKRQTGALGIVNGYVGVVEAQARGSLHLHLLLWLRGAPTARVMQEALKDQRMQNKIRQFISQNIRAQCDGDDIMLPNRKRAKGVTKSSVSFSRPIDPRLPDYDSLGEAAEARIASVVQYHNCDESYCLKLKQGHLRCKRRAPWPLYEDDWVKEDGGWGPKRRISRINPWNPALMRVTRANQDIKLLTHSWETKDIAFYITLYIAKKQIQAANASALLSHSRSFAKAHTQKHEDMRRRNIRLIEQCANTLTRQQELSGPEVVSYLMGWGDRYISHTYQKIYWDVATAAIRFQFPGIEHADFKLTPASDHATASNSTTRRAAASSQEEPSIQLTIQDGIFVLKDQLKEYSDRGEELSNMNFYDYFSKTYDSPAKVNKTQETHYDEAPGAEDFANTDASPESIIAGRPRSTRVPYLPSSKRSGCRIIKSGSRETNLHFIGRWFLSETDPAHEYYCAQLLLLLKPWRTLKDLVALHPSFEDAFLQFHSQAKTEICQIITNIQYYHECSDAANRRKDLDPFTRIPLEDENGTAQFTANEFSVQPTEEQIAEARVDQVSPAERAYGADALYLAQKMDLFLEHAPSTRSIEEDHIAKRCTDDDLIKYAEWGERVRALTRDDHMEDETYLVQPRDDLPDIITDINLRASQEPTVVLLTEEDELPIRTPEQQHAIDILNQEQRRAHDLIECHLIRTLRGEQQQQLLMIVQGEGGTGKTVVLNAIAHSFEYHRATSILAKTATTGVAASLTGGQTLHMWAGIPPKTTDDDSWIYSKRIATVERQKRNIIPAKYLVIDEFSMLTKKVLAQLSKILGVVKSTEGLGHPSDPFGGINVILFGDPHQFPPVGNPRAALYIHRTDDNLLAGLGFKLFRQFRTVVTLVEQKRVTDPLWMSFLRRLRVGDCTEDDISMLNSLLLSSIPRSAHPNWHESPWKDAVLITPRHSVRTGWNSSALGRHARIEGRYIYVCPSEDYPAKEDRSLTPHERYNLAQLPEKTTGRLSDRIEISIGMRAMVLLNISTEADLANGTRGTITGLCLDPREPETLPLSRFLPDCRVQLAYPPAVIFFKADKPSTRTFEDLPIGVLPIVPVCASFQLKPKKLLVTRRQYAITPAYAFTDYKSQGQTVPCLIVDLQPPPRGGLTPFSAYVALSRSHGRDSVRILRGFQKSLFTTHPSEDLCQEDIRLAQLTELTRLETNGLH